MMKIVALDHAETCCRSGLMHRHEEDVLDVVLGAVGRGLRDALAAAEATPQRLLVLARQLDAPPGDADRHA